MSRTLRSTWQRLVFVTVGVVPWLPVGAEEERPSPEQVEFFEKRIRPVLVAHCYACHSSDAAQVKGGLLLDTRAGVARGGESGPIVVPGEPAKSLLIQALRYADSAPAMPPRKQLSAEVIADFEKWVKLGVPDPRAGAAAPIRHEINIEKGRQFWAFVPPREVAPPTVTDDDWSATPIDRHLFAAMEGARLKPVELAEPATLVRRLYLDLVGLPPTYEESRRWVAKLTAERGRGRLAPRAGESPVVTALVDELLASPRFGERWGRHWLDVARFAETSGRQINFNYPHAWRYRDWVIAAFNADLPYNEFVRQQLAGDLLPARDAAHRASLHVATGFLAIGPKPHSERDAAQFEMDLIDEQIDVTTQAFLALSVACARCHDHKFDPIPQRDYYALAGIFRSTETRYGTVRIIQNLNPTELDELPMTDAIPSALPTLDMSELAQIQRKLHEVKTRYDERAKAGMSNTGVDFNAIGTLTARIADYAADGNPKRKAMGVRERAVAKDCPLYERGEIGKPLAAVPRGFVQVVAQAPPRIPATSSGRLELAEWITSRDNPLTARVLVNRVWTHLFGRGLVPTPDNFGTAGTPPENPALLDHLACTFMEDGWSIKRLLRRVVTTRAYQLGSRFDAANFEIDPDNIRVWRVTPRRLDAEVLRDALLHVSGRLEMSPPVGSPVAGAGEDNSNALLRKLPALDSGHKHRAVYLPVIRDSVVESLALFDFADPSLVVGQRTTTTVPAQSLYLLNSPFVQAHAEAAATRFLNEVSLDSERLQRIFVVLFGRDPTSEELRGAERFLRDYAAAIAQDRLTPEKRTRAIWTALCQALLASGDFLYRH